MADPTGSASKSEGDQRNLHDEWQEWSQWSRGTKDQQSSRSQLDQVATIQGELGFKEKKAKESTEERATNWESEKGKHDLEVSSTGTVRVTGIRPQVSTKGCPNSRVLSPQCEWQTKASRVWTLEVQEYIIIYSKFYNWNCMADAPCRLLEQQWD